MSSQNQAAELLLSVVFSFDGAVLGVSLAYIAVRSVIQFRSNSSALHKLREAPSASVADLRSIQSQEDSDHLSSSSSEGKLVIVRGNVEAKASVEANWNIVKSKLISEKTGDKAVIIQKTQTCLYNEWKGFFGWTSDLRTILSRRWRQRESSSTRMIPFVLVEDNQHRNDYVIVNMEGSRHALPLTTVHHQLNPINPSPYTLLQALFGHEYPVALLDEEKILQVGKEVNAAGLCFLRNGVLEIKSCSDLPYFLSEMSKEEMVMDLAFRTRIVFWSGLILGTVSVGILGFAFVRNWNRYKDWRERRRNPGGGGGVDRRRRNTSMEEEEEGREVDDDDEEAGNIGDGVLCVICLTRRRRSAFVPCGHLVCCPRCALSVEREVSPKCPVCRQSIHNSIRIYDS